MRRERRDNLHQHTVMEPHLSSTRQDQPCQRQMHKCNLMKRPPKPTHSVIPDPPEPFALVLMPYRSHSGESEDMYSAQQGAPGDTQGATTLSKGQLQLGKDLMKRLWVLDSRCLLGNSLCRLDKDSPTQMGNKAVVRMSAEGQRRRGQQDLPKRRREYTS
ncbi:hypothetical protein K431DRAFT_136895 [Polychaeton citri CBS 116435]|uniref:Uncharacterized protein n=1 Tax=Polychaeton citri CBS 116435 TaxID=1314669 RepID=A0A9P4Q5L0_9PEZI|nr:hypothetical protein K431DRAFT_136895 [Polychaeton citri CBS 116435]